MQFEPRIDNLTRVVGHHIDHIFVALDKVAIAFDLDISLLEMQSNKANALFRIISG